MGIFDQIASGLSKTRQNVLKEIKGTFGVGKLTPELMEQLEETLLVSDISFETVHEILERVEEKARGEAISEEQLLTWLAEATEELLTAGEEPKPVADSKPYVILIIGVNGSGKTTSIGKLAHRFKNEGKEVMLAAGDTFRAGAISQLQKWAEASNTAIIKHEEGSDAAAVAYDSYNSAKARKMDVLIIDTAGRLHNKAGLMEELSKMVRVLRKHDPSIPHETLLVVDGNTGQNAIQQGKAFNEIIPLNGLAVTKLDGTAKGGALITVSRELGIPIRWIGVGEGINDLVPFNPGLYARSMFLPEEKLKSSIQSKQQSKQ